MRFLRLVRVRVRLLFRGMRHLWRCPTCGRWSRAGMETPLDFYPMLLEPWKARPCCAREFPRWCYSDG